MGTQVYDIFRFISFQSKGLVEILGKRFIDIG
jgi:hypothetical protein